MVALANIKGPIVCCRYRGVNLDDSLCHFIYDNTDIIGWYGVVSILIGHYVVSILHGQRIEIMGRMSQVAVEC